MGFLLNAIAASVHLIVICLWEKKKSKLITKILENFQAGYSNIRHCGVIMQWNVCCTGELYRKLLPSTLSYKI